VAINSKLESNKAAVSWSLLLDNLQPARSRLERQVQKLLRVKDQGSILETLTHIKIPSNQASIELLRAYGVQQSNLGNPNTSQATLEAAFRLSVGQTDLAEYHHQVALDLAAHHHQQASDAVALSYLNAISPHQTLYPYALLTRAKIHCWQGKLEAAQQDLQKVWGVAQNNPNLYCLFAHTRAELAFAQQNHFEAHTQFYYVAQEAREQGLPELAFVAELGAAKVMLCLEDRNTSHKHLHTAQRYGCQSVYGAALFELRYGQWCSADSAQFALNHFATAFWHFEKVNCPREMIWVILNQADAYLKLGDTKAVADSLDTALNLAWKLEDCTAATELLLLPRLKAWIVQQPDFERHLPILGHPPTASNTVLSEPTIRLTTLGRTGLQIGSQVVPLEMQRTVEILSYLCLHPNSTLNQIRQDLFPGSSTKRAANHFHKVRERLYKTTQDLQIAFDKATQTYALRHRYRLEWDYQELQTHLEQQPLEVVLKHHYGVFLATAESTWAVTLRERLTLELHHLGHKTLGAYKKAGQLESFRALSEQLHRLEPLDIEFGVAYLESTHLVCGKSVADKLFEQMQPRFLAELGEVPTELSDLLRRLNVQ
jgi:tetratricopeptide (TPR) repeat protein